MDTLSQPGQNSVWPSYVAVGPVTAPSTQVYQIQVLPTRCEDPFICIWAAFIDPETGARVLTGRVCVAGRRAVEAQEDHKDWRPQKEVGNPSTRYLPDPDNPTSVPNGMAMLWARAPVRVQHYLMSHWDLMRTAAALHIDLGPAFVSAKPLAGHTHGTGRRGAGKEKIQSAIESLQQSAADAGLQPLDLSQVKPAIDQGEVLDSRGTAAAEASLRRAAEVTAPRGLTAVADRSRWVRTAVHDPHCVIVSPAGEACSALESGRGGSEGLVEQPCRLAAAPRKGAGRLGGSGPCVVTFKGGRRPGKGADAQEVQVGSKRPHVSPLETPFGHRGLNGLGASRPRPLPPVPQLASQLVGGEATGEQQRAKRAGSTRQPLMAEVAAPALIQVELTSAFDSEHGFTEGLYDIDSNTLYV